MVTRTMIIVGDDIILHAGEQKGWVSSKLADGQLEISFYDDYKTIACPIDSHLLVKASTPEGQRVIDVYTTDNDAEPWLSMRLPEEEFALLEKAAAEKERSLEEFFIETIKQALNQTAA